MIEEPNAAPPEQEATPRDLEYREEPGGTSGVGAFRRQTNAAAAVPEQPAVGSDPLRERRGEPRLGWNPEQPDGTPRSEDEFLEMRSAPELIEPGGTTPMTDDRKLAADSDAVREAAQERLVPWGQPGTGYPPTRGPIENDD
jgi:hypothetical protein